MDSQRAREIVEAFAGKRVLVVGDVMLDEYIWGYVSRISPEAPVMVVEADRVTHVPGGAANVVNNLCALGATGMIAGAVGRDKAAEQLTAALQAEGADTRGLVESEDRPTTRKTRIIAHAQQVVRVDHERRDAVDEPTTRQLIARVGQLAAEADAVILSDYQKGVLSPALLQACVESARLAGKRITGNLKPALLAGEAALDVITTNFHEAGLAAGHPQVAASDDAAVESIARVLLQRTGCRCVLITRGAHGLTYVATEGGGEARHVPAREVLVYDPAGAGDTVISTLTLALIAGADMLEATVLANHAAGEAVKKVGVATVSSAEVIASFDA